MNPIHQNLEQSFPWYKRWHEKRDYKSLHYILLIIAIAVIGAIVASSDAVKAAPTTYYVSTTGNDANPGTQAQPWKTLIKACNTVTNAGDTIHIAAGTYVEPAVQGTACNLAKGVNIEGEGKTNTIVKSSQTGTWSNYMSLESPNGTDGSQSISNFTLDGQANTSGNASGTWIGIWITGRSNVSIHDMKFMNFFTNATIFAGHGTTNPTTWAGPFATGNSFYNNDGTNCAGIFAESGWSGSGCLSIGAQDGMDIHHNNLVTTARPIERNGWPIKYWDNGFLKNVKIHDNTLIKSPFQSTQPFSPPNWDFAVELFNVQGMEFANNYVQGSVDINYIYKGTYPYGLWAHDNILDHNPGNFSHFESGFIFEFKAEKVIVENNIINNKSVGISFNTRTPSNTGGYTFPCGAGGCSANIDNVIRNNVFSNIYSSGGSTAGIAVISEQGNDPYISNMQIYNNTFVAKAGQPALFGLDFTSQNNGTVNGLYIRNNIFQGFSVASIANQAAQSQSNVLITHNDTWNTTAPAFAGGGVTMNNNLAVNPTFVSGTDFHLQATSPVIDKGINVGLPFLGAAPDMGAYETGGTPPPPDTTAPIVSSTTPTSNATGVAVGSDVVVTFSEALSAASVNTTTASIAGVSSAVSLNGSVITINPSANLAAGTTYTVTLMGGANGIKDLAGNALVNNYTFSFTTAAPANQPPTASAGPDQSIALPTSSVTLSGSGTDPENGPLTYVWSKDSGQGVITNGTSAVATVSGFTSAGSSVFRLRVTDNQGAFSEDTVSVFVTTAPDTVAPTVTVTSPTAGQTLSGNKALTVSASDNVGVDHVEYYRSGSTLPLGSSATGPSYSITWNTTTVPNGAYTITAKAYDAAGNVGVSAPVSVTVNNTVSSGPDTVAPTVSVTSPTAGQTLASMATIAANASDNVGVVVVRFYRTGSTTEIGSDATAPWAITWDTTTVANGSYGITAKAYDAAGNVGTSSAISISVNNVATPPSGTFTTWNPADKGANVILSNNNLSQGDNGYEGMVRAKAGKSAGKWYWEIKVTDRGANQDLNFYPGVAKLSAPKNKFLGYNKDGYGYWAAYGDKRNGNIKQYGPTFDEGDVIGLALDMDAKTLRFYKNCTDLGIAFSGLSGTIYPAVGQFGGDVKSTVNFGASPFTCPVPSGFTAGVTQ